MATYAIGDVQGCVQALHRLIEKIRFNPSSDRLWFVGDLVNRGPASLEVLRLIKKLEDSAITVLGNHDLHLLAVWAKVTTLSRKDTLQPVLSAPDVDELLTWLRFRPLAHVENGYCLIHAGLLPFWSISQVLKLTREVEEALRDDDFHQHLPAIYFRKPIVFSPHLSLDERLGLTTNVLTRLRVCTKEGIPEFSFKGHPHEAPPGFIPWFQVPDRATQEDTIIFGHWSALGVVEGPRVFAIDGGCVWGRELVALRLEDKQLFRVPCSRI
ncbi:symmetrical bis(5'-nucleosyl)-tetraphosphatase [Candidatus Nitrospira allomarina]|uniref:bis(5'-nucleosyl)-tetraphosphatase (symmetrical) n=1 Tax=Candidatus Nitrospira allomarina TaxID=3020900 RepID=A0AA96JZW1_9BACT|nr:symmetrical bis(5'-nucleosyl)-tetraphosphatase [Candidatus Nitrospira allomarina]WNM59084.1 symmetrical bis(5'-nucleosyl)-tetraphosphatase [Candidatus Nitrospira allomarina]